MIIAELKILFIFVIAKSITGAVSPNMFGHFLCQLKYGGGYFPFRETGGPGEGLSRREMPPSLFCIMLKTTPNGRIF